MRARHGSRSDRRHERRASPPLGRACTGILVVVFLPLVFLWEPPPPGVGASASPQMGGTPETDRLAKPTLPANPTQAAKGAEVYWLACMACHGDRGQGLTQEWRAAWGPEDQNCWQSKCHAANYPPGGFKLPQYIPPVVGPNALARFQTALDLYEYIKENMPWHAPGTLSEEEYWQLTAYLVRANGKDPGLEPLTPSRAAAIRLHPEDERSNTSKVIWGLAFVGGLGTIGLGIWWAHRRAGRPTQAVH